MNSDGAATIHDSASAPSAAERFHSLDAVRAFALLLGVVFHAAESFEPGVESYWAIGDSSPSVPLHLFRHACHSFRLELFFVIAGFFAHLVYHRRGQKEFIRNRANRILVPLAVGWCVMYPLLVFLWMVGAKTAGRLLQFGVPAEMTHTPLPLLLIGFFATGEFVKRFDLTHLWFLHQLLVLYAGALPVRNLWHRWLDPTGRWLATVDRWFGALCASRWKVPALAAVTAPLLLLMDGWNVDTPKASLLPHVPTTLMYGLFFGFGWLLHRQSRLLDGFARGWAAPMLLGLLLVVPTAGLVDWLRGLGFDPARAPWIRWLFSTLYALMMWGFVLGFLGAFVKFCRAESPGWRYVADSSYWIYIVHLPLVVALQILVARWPLPWIVKWPLILAVATPILFLSYHYLARPTFIGAQLNGRRYPRRWPWSARP